MVEGHSIRKVEKHYSRGSPGLRIFWFSIGLGDCTSSKYTQKQKQHSYLIINHSQAWHQGSEKPVISGWQQLFMETGRGLFALPTSHTLLASLADLSMAATSMSMHFGVDFPHSTNSMSGQGQCTTVVFQGYSSSQWCSQCFCNFHFQPAIPLRVSCSWTFCQAWDMVLWMLPYGWAEIPLPTPGKKITLN